MTFHQQINQYYSQFFQKSINKRQLQWKDIGPLLNSLPTGRFEVIQVGKSWQGKPLHLIKSGSGSRKVLFWSQMHGDESTATMALMDMFNFFSQSHPLKDRAVQILNKVTLLFIPLLNPDGAEKYQRRNAMEIDINRDAVRLCSPEARVLKAIQEQYQPEFGFNLHDQSTYYAAGASRLPASISFLAPAYDHDRNINVVRTKAIQLINEMNQVAQEFIPQQVARYDDTFEPRAFGDNMQKWGTSTILVETGGYLNDPEKQFLRKINVILLLSALDQIAEGQFEKNDPNPYFSIPENKDRLFEVLIKQVKMENNGHKYNTDLGIRQQVIPAPENLRSYFKSTIEDLGDLSTRFGYQEIEGSHLALKLGGIWPHEVDHWDDLQDFNCREALDQGYLFVRVKAGIPDQTYSPYPINVLDHNFQPLQTSLLDKEANFVLFNQQNIEQVVINGYVYKPGQLLNPYVSGIVYQNKA
ncbi:MAG: M14 family metallopeptidase [Candidatus Cyclobacteriaceae bacterium M3_2C_046]